MDNAVERDTHGSATPQSRGEGLGGEHAAGLHGSTPAAWTAVAIILVAFTLGAIAMVLGPNWVLFWISVAIAVIGAAVGKVMQLMGFGASVGSTR